MRRLPLLLFALFMYGLGLALMQQFKPDGGGARTLDEPLAPLTLSALDGKGVWKQDALKGKVTVINFFASWCAPCAEEMPQLIALKKQFPGISLQGVAWNDSPKTLGRWLKQYHDPFDTVWLDIKGEATIALGIKGIPETFIIDAKGHVRYRLTGVMSENVRIREVGLLITALEAEAHAAP